MKLTAILEYRRRGRGSRWSSYGEYPYKKGVKLFKQMVKQYGKEFRFRLFKIEKTLEVSS